jgi:hypothetical protein
MDNGSMPATAKNSNHHLLFLTESIGHFNITAPLVQKVFDEGDTTGVVAIRMALKFWFMSIHNESNWAYNAGEMCLLASAH